MEYALMLLTLPIFAICNRARGSQAFGLVSSTVEGRAVGMSGIAMITALFYYPNGVLMAELFLVTFAGFMTWATFGWDAYWSAMIGNDPAHSKFWGLMMMTLRMAMLCPVFAIQGYLSGYDGVNYPSLLPLLYALVYYFWGAVDKVNSVQYSEYAIGAFIGVTTLLIRFGIIL